MKDGITLGKKEDTPSQFHLMIPKTAKNDIESSSLSSRDQLDKRTSVDTALSIRDEKTEAKADEISNPTSRAELI